MDEQSSCSHVDAVSELQKAMICCRSFAEMPVPRVEISKVAWNHTLSGFLVFSNTAPDVRFV